MPGQSPRYNPRPSSVEPSSSPAPSAGLEPRSQPTSRPYPGPRTTTRGDARTGEIKPAQPEPRSRTVPDNGRRYAPAPVGGSVRAGGGKPVAPSPSEIYNRGTTRPSSGTKGKPIDPRYTPTKPVAAVGTTPFDPRPSANPKGPGASGRYTTGTLAPRSVTPSLTPGTPKLVAPTAGAPRLQPRSLVSGSVGTVGSFSKPVAYASNCWWDPCASYHHSNWHSNCWSWYGGSGCYGFGVSCWYPWYHCHSYYYNSCYSHCWWNSWCDPYYPSWNYWWYPSSTYCPTYFYVPSSVVVVDSGYTGGEEVVVAGSPVGGSVQVADRSLAPNDLAKKYVELGDFYFKAGRFAEAEDAYARARTYAPDDASIHFVLADAAFATGDYHFAAFLIAEALRLEPSMASANTDKRLFYGDPKLFEEQMAQLDKYLAEKPYDASAHLVRGYNLRFSDKSAAAIAAFRRVLEIAPEQPAARIFLGVLEPAKGEEPAKKAEEPAKTEDPKKG